MLTITDLKLLNERIINLEVNPGEVIFVKGANGIGKSLFLKTLARLLPRKSGALNFEMSDSAEYPIELWRSKILYLPSEVSFSEDHSVDEYLAEPLTFNCYKDFKSSFNPKEFVSELNSRMSLLSTGQRQRLSILRAMSLNASILLLDESFSHLDPVMREETFELLNKWKGDNRIIFIVSHFDIITSQFDTRTFNL